MEYTQAQYKEFTDALNELRQAQADLHDAANVRLPSVPRPDVFMSHDEITAYFDALREHHKRVDQWQKTQQGLKDRISDLQQKAGELSPQIQDAVYLVDGYRFKICIGMGNLGKSSTYSIQITPHYESL